MALGLNLKTPTSAAPPAAADALHLLAIGDFGTTGKLQHAVAGAMRDFLQRHRVPLEALLLLGDNFYGDGSDDPLDPRCPPVRVYIEGKQVYQSGDVK